MPFVQAKCPNCGGFLAVDNARDAAVCQFCGTPFIVEKAVNNYNISVNNNINLKNANIRVEGSPTTKSLLSRARSFIFQKDYDRAFSYFERVLDIDPGNHEAKAGIKYLTVPKLENLVIRREKAFSHRNKLVSVIVDNVEVGCVGNGGNLFRMVSLGPHIISFPELGYMQVPFTLPTALQYAEYWIHDWMLDGHVYDFVENPKNYDY